MMNSVGVSKKVLLVLGFGLLSAQAAQAQLYGATTNFNYQTSLNMPNSLSADRSVFMQEFEQLGVRAPEAGDTRTIEYDQSKAVLDKFTFLINEVRAKGRSCGDKYYTSVAPVKHNEVLAIAAKYHNADMLRNNFFDHRGSDGSNGGARMKRIGYQWRAWGENLAAGFSSPEEVVQGWVNSPSHCANLMNSKFKEFGLSRAMGLGGDEHWTLNLATPI